MINLGYYNGRFDELEKMYIPMNDRASYFGDGCYDTAYSRNHIIYNLDEHIDRFYLSASLLRIDIPHTKNELKDILNSMLSKVDCGECFIYWQATRGTGIRSHQFPTDGSKANIWITITPEEVFTPDVTQKVITVEDTRYLHCNIKTLNLLPSVLAIQKAVEAGCDEAIFHRNGRVTECAHSNVHIIKNEILITAPADNLILHGIARTNLIKMCKKLGYAVEEREYSISELMEADEVILTNCGAFCTQITEVDGIKVGGKSTDMLKKLQTALFDDFIDSTNIKIEK